MMLSILLSILMMAGLFLLLYAAVALIQDKRFFTSAPKAVQDAAQPKEERFRGQHALGWVLAIVAILCMFAALFIGAADGIKNDFSFLQFFGRFLTMLLHQSKKIRTTSS